MAFRVMSELDVRRLPNGRRTLLADLICVLAGTWFTIPEGFDTDYSSWKGWIPGPGWQKIDIAGIVHDFIWRFGYLGVGLDARPVGFWEGNQIWWTIARQGCEETRCGPVSAAAGIAGLTIGGWVSWLRYGKSREEYAESLRARKEEART